MLNRYFVNNKKKKKKKIEQRRWQSVCFPGDQTFPKMSLLLKERVCFWRNKLLLIYEIEFALFLAMLEIFVLPMGWDSSHATLKVT